MQKSLDTAWGNWKDLIDKLTTLERANFEPVPSVDCKSEPQSGFAFCNPDLRPQDRATDLVSQLSLQELIEQTSFAGPAIPRLGINAYNWKSTCMHGWGKVGSTPQLSIYSWTVFPAPIGLAATFNPRLLQNVGQTTANEGRALHNLLLVSYNGDSVQGGGLNCIGPNYKPLIDPRWGEAQEMFGEDPLLISTLGVAYTVGLQGKSKYLKVGATAGHFPMTTCPEKLHKMAMHDLFDTHFPAFRSQLLGGSVSQIFVGKTDWCNLESTRMNNGPEYLLKTVLRQRLGAGNISVCANSSSFHSMEPGLAAALLINATADIDFGSRSSSEIENFLREKVIAEQAIRNAVWRNFYVRIRLGDFDPPELVPYQYIDGAHLNTPVHQTLNLQTAQESIVLLKNLGNRLPLHIDSLNKLAVIGPNANTTATLLATHAGAPAFVVSVLQGIREAVNRTHVAVEYRPGCADVVCSDTSLFEAAVDIVHDADFVIMVMGLDQTVENGDRDRVSTKCGSRVVDSLSLPGCQERLVEEVIDYNSRVILILINGGPLSIPNLFTHKGVVGILEAFYPGALGGRAVSDVLFGRYNPGGRMPYMTGYDSSELPLSDVMHEENGHTYRYINEEPLIPFGYGLSYSSFEYINLDIPSAEIQPCDSIKFSVSVQNEGEVEGDEVIQVYVVPPRLPDKPFIPKIQLVAFERVNIHPGVVHVASFELNSFLLSLVDEDGEHYIFPGEYKLVVTGGLEEKELNQVFRIGGGSVVRAVGCTGIPMCLACYARTILYRMRNPRTRTC